MSMQLGYLALFLLLLIKTLDANSYEEVQVIFSTNYLNTKITDESNNKFNGY